MFNLIGLKKILSIRSLIVMLLLLAFIMIVIDVTKMNYKCPTNKIEYRYIPRSFEDEQDNIIPIKQIFGKMFDNPSPWINSFTESPLVENSNVRQN
jgi:hypothetical protein